MEDYLEAQDPELRKRLRASMRAYRSGRGRPAREFLDVLLEKGPQLKRMDDLGLVETGIE